MTRSKDQLQNGKQERHFARNGLNDNVRSPVKKSGAGHANWGTYADEIAVVEDAHMEYNDVSRDQDQKLQLVDKETFHSLRHPEQNV
ncbi:hypothetical protein BC941DRAFT_421181 [Chlamydoabsidia padenii]|nr:hypothetical protein BC941DRAFT_421181 [Chlamydoabsidia padenii]